MPGAIPSGLGAMLGKLAAALGGAQAEGQGQPAAKEGAEGKLQKGQRFGPDGQLLAGKGYAGADAHSSHKNANERGNLASFLHAKGEGKKDGAEQARGGQLGAAVAEAFTGKEAKPADPKATAQEGDKGEQADKGDKSEARREEGPREAKQDGPREVRGEKQLEKQAESRKAESQQAERERDQGQGQQQQQQQQQDEEDKPGAGWVAEELREEELKQPSGLRVGGQLDGQNQCQAHTADGVRCLHRAVDGSPFCAAHAGYVAQAGLLGQLEAPAAPEPAATPPEPPPGPSQIEID